jgi:cysteinyl-tRNA synthetase
MTVRFFILQTHYRSTLDFGNEALQAAEKGLKRLMDAYEWLQKTGVEQLAADSNEPDRDLEDKVKALLLSFAAHMNDDFSTARVLAAMFELVPVINGIKDKAIAAGALSAETFQLLQKELKTWVEDILGLRSETAHDNKLEGVMEVLINLRKEARARRDWATSDAIRNQLAAIGVQIKDEKGGDMSWSA